MTHHPHPTEDLTNGRYVSYIIKFEGKYAVPEASGPSTVQSAFIDMKRAKEERRKKGQKRAPVMELQISVNGLKIINRETLASEVDVSLTKISYIMNDRNNRLYAAFVFRTPEDTHECVVVKDDAGKSREIVLTIAEVFDIAFQKKNESRPTSLVLPTETKPEEQEKMKATAREVEILRSRLKQLATMLPEDQLNNFLQQRKIKDIAEILKEDEQETPTIAERRKEPCAPEKPLSLAPAHKKSIVDEPQPVAPVQQAQPWSHNVADVPKTQDEAFDPFGMLELTPSFVVEKSKDVNPGPSNPYKDLMPMSPLFTKPDIAEIDLDFFDPIKNRNK